MTAIWCNSGPGWQLLAPSGFPNEAALHTLVEQTPEMLPLAGSPRLIVVGREVTLGSGAADLIAVEPNGRVAVIEIKLARNAEARRAVVAQVLAYAAYLHGVDPMQFETNVLGRHLRAREFENLAAAVSSSDQEGSFDPASFAAGLAESLGLGQFRLVLVLDAAPDELVRLVGYLESVTDKLIIDLITVTAYAVGESQIMVPQRIEPERVQYAPQTAVGPPELTTKGYLAEGTDDFEASIATSRTEYQETLHLLYTWAKSLEAEGLVRLATYHGKRGGLTLLTRLRPENVGLVSIYNDSTGASIQFWRSVFLRRAPQALPRVEALLAPRPLGQGTWIQDPTPELLAALTDAHREAARGHIDTVSSAGDA
jgi:hypothetical protein